MSRRRARPWVRADPTRAWASGRGKTAKPGKSLPSAPYILNSSDNRRTAAVLSDTDWAKAFTKATGRPAGKWNWQWSHHLFAATMLTHALAQGDLS